MIRSGPSSSPASIPPEVKAGGVVSGKFRVDRVLGEGGMGVVVAATHLQLDEPVALKFLRAEAVAESEALARFMREAQAAAKLKSEHVARVLDVAVTDEGSPYIVMEYLEGRDLARTVQADGPFDVASATELVIQACEGLSEAHARGIVHRDIKPENLFLVERAQGWKTVKILDFGISKIAMPAGMANVSTRSIMGSPCYMSPEQLRSTAGVDHRTDIWSLGATLYELLAGKTAYDSGRSLPELVTAILENPAPRLSDVRPDAPAELTAVICRCLEKDREKRFGSASELAVALLPFAPKRARTSVERAIAMARSAGHSSGSLDQSNFGEAKTVPPAAPAPGPQAEGVPVSVNTLKARSGSNLLVKAPSEPPPAPAGTLGTLSVSAVPASGSRRGALWAGVAAVVTVVAIAGSWQVLKAKGATGSAAPVVGAAAVQAPVATPVPAPVPEPVREPASASASAPAPAPAPASAAAQAPASAQPHHASAPPRPQQHQAQSPPNPQASPERDLDIRMQR